MFLLILFALKLRTLDLPGDTENFTEKWLFRHPIRTHVIHEPCIWSSSPRVLRSSVVRTQGAKKIIFTACHSGKLKLAFTSPDVTSTSPKSFLTSRIAFKVLLLFQFLKKHHLPVGQVKNRIH